MLRCTCRCRTGPSASSVPSLRPPQVSAANFSPSSPTPNASLHTSSRPHPRAPASLGVFDGRTGRLSEPGGGAQRRSVSDGQTFRGPHGTVKVNLKNKATVGAAQSRGERPYQEDTYLTTSLSLPLSALRINILDDRLGSHWAPLPQHLEGFEGEHGEDKEERRRQVACFGVFDGHGGSPTSQYLSHSLPSLIESARARDIPAEIDAYRAQGGYLRRYRGGVLERFRAEKVQEAKERGDFVRGMSAGEMAALGFLKADNHVLSTPSEFSRSGSVGTLALLHSLDLPHSHPFYSSSLLSLTLAHLGDTSALLLSSASGRAYRLTQAHHPDSRTEMERLRTTGTGVITDSFGESRWGGMLANTRGVGDREFKSLGVIAEPEVVKRVFKGPDFASLLLLSDGITDALSDQEIADLVRLEIYAARGRKELASPERAARRVVGLAEDVGAEDNLTCLVIPLPGWSKLQGLDTTLSRREYRVRQASTRGGSRQRG